jgi:tetrahydromethanopterin S-methyltransferase subunit A
MEIVAGAVCKKLLPIPISSFSGKGKTVAVCTLSSLDLLQAISKDEIMNKILIVGRLYSENKGIDDLINYCTNSSTLKYLVLCGQDTRGHYSGDALIKLGLYGVDSVGRIINTKAPRPYLTLKPEVIEKFRSDIQIIDMREVCKLEEIKLRIDDLG